MPDEVVNLLQGAATESILFATIIVVVAGIVAYVRTMRPIWLKRLEIEAEQAQAVRALEDRRIDADRALVASINHLGEKLETDQSQQTITQDYLKLMIGAVQTLNDSLTQWRESERENWRSIGKRMSAITDSHMTKLDKVLHSQVEQQVGQEQFEHQVQEFLHAMEKRLVTVIAQSDKLGPVKAQLDQIQKTVDAWVKQTGEKLSSVEVALRKHEEKQHVGME